VTVFGLAISGFAALAFVPSRARAQTAAPHRYAVVIGANKASPGRRDLRYAHNDAQEVADTLIRVAGFALFRLLLPKLGKPLPRIIEDLAIIAVYTAYGLSQLRLFGVDLTGILATSAIITAILAFAMQDTLGNVLGGLAIQLDNSVRVGDWIQLDSVSGRVTDIRWRSTTLETRDWATVVIPNSALMKNRFTILGRREGAPLQWRRHIRFMVDPAVPPARVIARSLAA